MVAIESIQKSIDIVAKYADLILPDQDHGTLSNFLRLSSQFWSTKEDVAMSS